MVHIIKVYFFDNSKKDQEIRRLAVTSDVVSNFKLLLEKIVNVFQLPDAGNLEIKWRDPENDFILMSSNDELAQALANAEDGLLRLYICLKTDKPKSTNIPTEQGIAHPLVICDGCDQNIVGARYKCLQCHDYDLCSSCEIAGKHLTHDMIKFAKPTYIPREWVFMGARKLWKSMNCPMNKFRHFDYGNKHVPNANGTSDQPNVDSQASGNTMPKSAASSASCSPTSQPKEKSSSNPDGTATNPLPDFGNLPQTFMKFFQGDLNQAPKLINEGMSQFLKGLQGTFQVVDSNLHKAQFTSGQECNENQNSRPSATNVQTETTKSDEIVAEPSTSASNQSPEVVSPDASTNNENVDSAFMNTDNAKSATNAVANENEDEIIIDIYNTSENPSEESAAHADGWTLLEEDTNRMECNDASDGRSTEKEVIYPNLMEVEANPEKNKDSIQSTDPVIVSGVKTMQAMGFTNEGGWLERLVISKHGNINEALEALYPSIRH